MTDMVLKQVIVKDPESNLPCLEAEVLSTTLGYFNGKPTVFFRIKFEDGTEATYPEDSIYGFEYILEFDPGGHPTTSRKSIKGQPLDGEKFLFPFVLVASPLCQIRIQIQKNTSTKNDTDNT